MVKGARSLDRRTGRAVTLARVVYAAFLISAFFVSESASAQFGPVQHDGFLEYQFRINRSEDAPDYTTNLASWRAHASTWVWRPYILQLDGTLGLTRGADKNSDVKQQSSFVTGAFHASAFPRSRFPFRAYFETRDSRVDGGVFERDLVTRTWGFLQQYSPQKGGRLSIDFKQVDTDELLEDGIRRPRNTVSDLWQIHGAKSLGRNEFRLLGSLRDISRNELLQSENRKVLNLRHRFRTSPRFFIEDTTFYSDERIDFDSSNTQRRFLQFNGVSTWRPQTKKPLLVIGRALAQGVDAGPVGFESGSKNFILTGAANYQFSSHVTLSGNIGVTSLVPDDNPDESSAFQRIRATYRSDNFDLGNMVYTWGGSAEAGNRREPNNGDDSIQDIAGNLNHSLSRFVNFTSGRLLQVSFSQQLAALVNTDDINGQTLVHSAFLTLSRQNGRMSNYLRLSASDRRAFGHRDGTFQLVTLQGSARMQLSRKRSWNGGVTLQYNNNSTSMLNEEERDDSAFTYSVNLSYVERDLFKVPRLNFLSELRLLSSDFRSDDILDQGIGVDPDRDDKSWRNRLDYRVGRLELQLLADVRDINNRWMSQVFFTVRRYYGDI
jgi:hypothetical protein